MGLEKVNLITGVETVVDFLINSDKRSYEAMNQRIGKKVLVLDWHNREQVGVVVKVNPSTYFLMNNLGITIFHHHDLCELYDIN